MESELVFRIDQLQSDPQTGYVCQNVDTHGRLAVDATGRLLVCGLCPKGTASVLVDLDAYPTAKR